MRSLDSAHFGELENVEALMHHDEMLFWKYQESRNKNWRPEKGRVHRWRNMSRS